MVRLSLCWSLAVLGACASPRTRIKAAAADTGIDGGLPELDGGPDAGSIKLDGGELRLLFVGNSYTYVNDLPGMLAMIAGTSGVPPTIRVAEIVQGGAELEDHWDNDLAQPAIADGGWTHVVVQGSSGETLPVYCANTFQYYAEQFGELIEDAGATPTWFVTWARAAGSDVYPSSVDTPAEMQDEVTSAYDAVARAFPSSLLACAGPAFQLAIAAHPEIALQQSDFSHPTVAGTYLAACTFYVALTGKPVPDASEIPAGLSASDAATLRAIATIGSNCADVKLKGIARLLDGWGYQDETTPDGGAFNYGVTGLPISSIFYVQNLGETAMQLSDATLPSSFVWTNGDYPGGAGEAPGNLTANCFPMPPGVSYCGATLDPQQSCALSVSYTGESTSAGAVSVSLSDAYTQVALRQVSGVATDRAQLTVCDTPVFLPCGPSPTCERHVLSSVFADAGGAVDFTVFVGNRGAVPATSLTGDPPAPPFGWAGSGFPGGAGALDTDAGTFDYCHAPLAPGDFCVLTGQFLPTDAGVFLGLLQISYSDSQGPVAEPADWPVEGETPFDAGPPLPF